MSLEAGRLRHRVRIERFDYLRDSNGDAVQDPNTGEIAREWVLVKEVSAEISDYSVREFLQSQATQSQTNTMIVIRWMPGVDAGMRAVHVARDLPPVYYNIHGVQADKESGREYLTLPCSRGVNEGQ